MPFYYLIVLGAVMPRHWLAMTTMGGFTLVKLTGFAALGWALARWPTVVGRRLYPGITFALFGLFYAVAMTSALLRGGWYLGYGDLAKLLSILSLLVVTHVLVDTPRKLRHALIALTVIGAGSSYYAISQFVLFSGIYKGFRTFGGVAGDSNYYALTMIITVPLGIYLFTTASGKIAKLIYLASIACMLVGFTLAASRGGMLGLGTSLLYLFLRSKYRWRLLLLSAVVVVPLLLYLPSSPLRRLMNPTHSEEAASEFRRQLWRAAWRLFLDHPAIGVGTDGFQQRLQEYEENRLGFTAVHNTLLESLATWGLAGTMPLVAFLFSLHRRAGQVAKLNKSGPVQFAWLARTFQGSLIAYCVGAQFLSTWYHMSVWVVLFLALCMLRMAHDENMGTQPAATRTQANWQPWPQSAVAPRTR